MDGLITGTIFVTITLLFLKIGEWIDRSFTRRYQKRLEPKVPTLRPEIGKPIPTAKVEMIPMPPQEKTNPWGVSMEEMQTALIAVGKAMTYPIDTTLKGEVKPPFLTDQEWMDQTIDRSLSDQESEIHVDETWYIETEEEFEEAWSQACLTEQKLLDQIRIARNRRRPKEYIMTRDMAHHLIRKEA
jgi:hypothetical protein